MYSHGSSVRIGVGKRGHGGRNYRPPPDNNNKKRGDDPNKLIPPPLKECNCMIQLDVPEYAEIASSSVSVSASASSSDHNNQSSVTGGVPPRRLHLCFEGSTLDERRKSVREIEKELRSEFGVHLVIPGRNQRGPLAVVGVSHRETIPATAYLMKRLIFDDPSTSSSSNAATTATTSAAAGTNNTSSSIVFFLTGRIQNNVKDPNGVVLLGRFFQHQRLSQQQQMDVATQFLLSPYWLFESASWNVMVCPLTSPTIQQPLQQHQQQHQQSGSSMTPLSTVSGDGNSSSMTQSSSSSSMTKQEETSTMILAALQTCVDNLRFRLGNLTLSELDIFLHPTPPSLRYPESAFATGNSTTRAPNNHQSQHPAPILALFEEIRQVRVTLPDGVAITML
jgi:hypothetical protein